MAGGKDKKTTKKGETPVKSPAKSRDEEDADRELTTADPDTIRSEVEEGRRQDRLKTEKGREEDRLRILMIEKKIC
jgi:hypothetical protein